MKIEQKQLKNKTKNRRTTVKTKIFVRIALLVLVTVGLTGCLGNRNYRPLTTTERSTHTETRTDYNGKTETFVVTDEKTTVEPPQRYYNNNSRHNNYRPHYNYGGRGRTIHWHPFGKHHN